MKKIIFISLFLIALKPFIFSQNIEIKWQQCYGGSEEDSPHDILPVNNNYFIVGGTASNDGDVSYSHGEYDAWLIKTDSIGNILWEKTYGGSEGDAWGLIFPTNNNCFYLIGNSVSSDGDISNDPYPGSNDIWVVKIDSSGNILWDKIIGGGMIDAVESGTLANDGGLVIFGWTGSQNGDISVNYGIYDMWMVKMNSEGDILWDKSFGTDDFDYGHSIIQTSDGGFLIGGASTIGNGGNLTCEPFNYNAEAILLKLDSIGNIEWQACYGGSDHEGIYGLIELDDGYIFSAYAYSPDGDVTGWHGNADIWIVRTDFWGNIIWEQCYGGFYSEIAHQIYKKDSGDFIIIGQTKSNDGDVNGNHSFSQFERDIWIICISSNGELKWQKCIGGGGNDASNGTSFGIVKKNENNFIILSITDYGPSYDVGCTPHGGNNVDQDYWLFEIELDDTTGIEELSNSKNIIKTYPNPTRDYVVFEIQDSRTMNQDIRQKTIENQNSGIVIMDVFGKEIARLPLKPDKTVWDTRQIPGGVYFYSVEIDNKFYTGKVVVQK